MAVSAFSGESTGALNIQQWFQIARQSLGQRHFHENDRLVDKRRMKEGKASPVGLEAPVKIGPAIDFMDRFVSDQFFQDQSRSVPADAFEAQKTAIEPGPEQVPQVEIEGGEISVTGRQNMFAHGDESFGTARRRVDPAEQLLTRRFDGCR